MAEKPSLVHVEIFGQTYAVRAGTDPAYVEKLAAFVDEQMKDVSRSSGAVDSLRVAVLTALNLADECFRLGREAEDDGLRVPGGGRRGERARGPAREGSGVGARGVASALFRLPRRPTAAMMLARLSALPVMDTATSNQRLS